MQHISKALAGITMGAMGGFLLAEALRELIPVVDIQIAKYLIGFSVFVIAMCARTGARAWGWTLLIGCAAVVQMAIRGSLSPEADMLALIAEESASVIAETGLSGAEAAEAIRSDVWTAVYAFYAVAAFFGATGLVLLLVSRNRLEAK